MLLKQRITRSSVSSDQEISVIAERQSVQVRRLLFISSSAAGGGFEVGSGDFGIVFTSVRV